MYYSFHTEIGIISTAPESMLHERLAIREAERHATFNDCPCSSCPTIDSGISFLSSFVVVLLMIRHFPSQQNSANTYP